MLLEIYFAQRLVCTSEQKNKVKKISEFSYLAYGQIRKQGKLGNFVKASISKFAFKELF